MPSELPPRPSRRVTIALAAVALVTLLYSLIVTAQVLLWFVLVGGAVGLYLVWLLIVAVFRLVGAVERIATAAEVDSGVRSVADAAPGPDSHRNGNDATAADVLRDDSVTDGPDGDSETNESASGTHPEDAADPGESAPEGRSDDSPVSADSEDRSASADSEDGSASDGSEAG